jgi:hypothetical protein
MFSASPPKPPSKSRRNAPHPTTRKRPRETLWPFGPESRAFFVSGWRCRDRQKANLRKFRGYSDHCQNQKSEAIWEEFVAEGPGFEPGLTDRDSGVELSPTGTDRRGGPRTASNRTVRASSAIAAGSTRWLMRRTKRPLSASLEEWPVLAATPIYKDPHPRVEPPNSTNQSSGDPSRQPMQTDDGKAH